MSLGTYAELQSAVRTELANIGTAALSAEAIEDAIARAEAKINRRARFREMETLATVSYTSASRFVALPSGFLELIGMRIKGATEADTKYVDVRYTDPGRIHEYYDTTMPWRYTLRDQIEIAQAAENNKTLSIHYLKRWDIASDSTNWLLTNFPDVYLYGACAECEMHLSSDARVPMWKALFDSSIEELNKLDSRGRDDSRLDTSEVAGMTRRYRFNIVGGNYA